MDSPTATKSFRWLFWLLAVIGLATDQTSKYWLFDDLCNDGRGGQIPIIEGAFNIQVVFEGLDDSPLANMSQITMNQRVGSSTESGPISHSRSGCCAP